MTAHRRSSTMGRAGIVYVIAVCGMIGAAAALEAQQLWNPSGFIRVQGNSFVDDDCKEWLPNGWNTWNSPMLDIAIKAANQSAMNAASNPEEQQILAVFSEGAIHGFNVMRMFLTPARPQQNTQDAPGEYNEEVWRGIDFLLDAARRSYVKLILVWVNNWQLWEGPAWWIEPNSTELGSVPRDQFWADEGARDRLYNHMFWVVNRRNTYNNVIYKEDPTIFAWNMYNELRCPASQEQNEEQLTACLAEVQKWVDETSTYLKMIDPNHLVTLGEEGFFGRDSELQQFNPDGTPGNVRPGWAAWIGQDFERQHAVANIDFLSFHMWPDNWRSFDMEWADNWITAHVTAANNLSKPLLLQEFGKRSDKARAADIKDPYYHTVYKRVMHSLENNDILKGSLFWYWDPFNAVTNRATESNIDGDFPPSGSVVHSDGSDPTTWQTVTEHSEAQYVMQQRVVQDCIRLGDADDYVSAGTVLGRR